MFLIAAILLVCGAFAIVMFVGLFMFDPVSATIAYMLIGAICWHSYRSVQRDKQRGKGIWAQSEQGVAGRSTPALVHEHQQPAAPQQTYTHDALDDFEDDLE